MLRNKFSKRSIRLSSTKYIFKEIKEDLNKWNINKYPMSMDKTKFT